MNLKVKNSLIITGTLILGIIIGILICGRFTKMKIEKYKNFYTAKGFRKEFIRTVKPTPEQLKRLQPLFKENAERNKELFRKFREEKEENYKEFRSEVEKILTPEQIERFDMLESRHEKMRRMRMKRVKRNFKKHHPKPFKNKNTPVKK